MESGKNNKIYLLILSLLILSALLFLFSMFLDSKKTLEVKELPTKLIIGDHNGFDLSKEYLGFGMIADGASSTRDDITVKNTHSFPVELDFNVEGNISSYLIYDKKMVVEPGEEKKVVISAIASKDTPYNTYYGKIVIKFRRQ